ncbi:sulfatase [Aquiflexum sp.]|uniref:sulfatase family protein n=1 Tax=Aquiflexum sp. TaxID=1872584 RepID=UPI0035937BF8
MKIHQFVLLSLILLAAIACSPDEKESKPPNILFVISDDQSFFHTSFAGSKFINTPAFDRVAAEGVYFTNCIAGSPGCAPARSAIVTGRHHWQNEQSGQHASSWLKKHVPFVDLLDDNGYATGLTGKGVAPFQYARDEKDSLWRATNAAGIHHSNIRYTAENDERPADQISDVNYFANFVHFMENVRDDQPFFFWYGSSEPHRAFEEDSWKRTDKKPEDVQVPGFFPDHEIVRGDMLDYAVEIEWFDLHLAKMMEYLEEIGELDNTIIIVTSDNGMAFPRAKANSYEYGVHVPLAIRYPTSFPRGRIVDDLIGFIDFAPTILDLTGTTREGMLPMSGQSITHILKSDKQGLIDPTKKHVYSGRERHSSSRHANWGYPQRAIRSQEYLYIWNMKPDRWPSGDPVRIKPDSDGELYPMHGLDENGVHHSEWAYTDIDAAPTKSFIIENMDDENVKSFFDLTHAKRPEFELYNIVEDPYNLENLAGNAEHTAVEKELKAALLAELKKSEDPRIVGPDTEIFDSYIRYSPMREFPHPSVYEK